MIGTKITSATMIDCIKSDKRLLSRWDYRRRLQNHPLAMTMVVYFMAALASRAFFHLSSF